MSKPKIYAVTLQTNQGLITVNDIWRTDEEGGQDQAIHDAIILLRDEGVKGLIKFVSAVHS